MVLPTTSVCPALCPPWKRTTTSARLASQSTILPLPSSPHWAPTTVTLAKDGAFLRAGKPGAALGGAARQGKRLGRFARPSATAATWRRMHDPALTRAIAWQGAVNAAYNRRALALDPPARCMRSRVKGASGGSNPDAGLRLCRAGGLRRRRLAQRARRRQAGAVLRRGPAAGGRLLGRRRRATRRWWCSSTAAAGRAATSG